MPRVAGRYANRGLQFVVLRARLTFVISTRVHVRLTSLEFSAGGKPNQRWAQGASFGRAKAGNRKREATPSPSYLALLLRLLLLTIRRDGDQPEHQLEGALHAPRENP